MISKGFNFLFVRGARKLKETDDELIKNESSFMYEVLQKSEEKDESGHYKNPHLRKIIERMSMGKSRVGFVLESTTNPEHFKGHYTEIQSILNEKKFSNDRIIVFTEPQRKLTFGNTIFSPSTKDEKIEVNNDLKFPEIVSNCLQNVQYLIDAGVDIEFVAIGLGMSPDERDRNAPMSSEQKQAYDLLRKQLLIWQNDGKIKFFKPDYNDFEVANEKRPPATRENASQFKMHGCDNATKHLENENIISR